MARYGLAVDIERCTGCYSCFLACKDEYVGNDYLPSSAAQPASGHTWLRIEEVPLDTGEPFGDTVLEVFTTQTALSENGSSDSLLALKPRLIMRSALHDGGAAASASSSHNYAA